MGGRVACDGIAWPQVGQRTMGEEVNKLVGGQGAELGLTCAGSSVAEGEAKRDADWIAHHASL